MLTKLHQFHLTSLMLWWPDKSPQSLQIEGYYTSKEGLNLERGIQKADVCAMASCPLLAIS